MARSKNKPVLTPPGWRQALKARFLNFAFHHNPDALRQLATEGRSGSLSPREWAIRYSVGRTWVEEWAADAIEAWRTYPSLFSGVDQQNNVHPAEINYPAPREEKAAADVFSFSVATVPPSKLSLGITMGGSVPDGQPDDDWLRFRKQMHESLDDALDSYRENALRSGATCEVLIPNDLLRKTEATAVYFFRAMSPEQIAPKLVERVGDRTTVYRWIKEISKLLDLPIKRSRR